MQQRIPRTATISFSIALLAAVLLFSANLNLSNVRSSEQHFRQAIISHQEDNLADANRELAAAIRLAPGNAYYVSCKGLIAERIVEKMGGNRLFHNFLNGTDSISGVGKQFIRDSIRFYQTALSLNPRDGLFHHNLGWLYWFDGDRTKAINSLKQAIASGDDDPLYYVSLGLMQERNGDREGALKSFQTAIEQSPRILDSRFFAALKKRDPEKAALILRKATADLEAVVQQNANPILRARLGRLYLESDPDKAFSMLNGALAQLPNMSVAWSNLGVLYEKKDWATAIGYYEKAAFLENSEALVFARLAKAYESVGGLPDAARKYEKAVACEITGASEHARKVLSLYHTQVAEANDLVPRDLLSYCSPTIDVAFICRKLAEYYAKAGNGTRSRYYNGLGNRWLLDQELKGGY